jgi:hypothetical protein
MSHVVISRSCSAGIAVSAILALLGIGVAWAQPTGEVISAVTMNYDRSSGKGDDLSTAGPVTFGRTGIVVGSNAKSGWVNWSTKGVHLGEDGRLSQVRMLGVSFWVNQDGHNWFDFEVARVISDTDSSELPFTTGIEATKSGRLPFVQIQGGDKLRPHLITLNFIFFVSKEAIAAVQRRLASLGYQPGSADGRWGGKTEAAVIRFQKDRQLRATGWIDDETLASLISQ